MAVFRLAVGAVSRRTGRSAPAAAAYRAGLLIVNKRTGRTHDFRRRGGVETDGTFIVHPVGCEWAGDRTALWNEVEVRENRKDAKVAREVVAALPYGLDKPQRKALCLKFGRHIVDSYSVAVDVAMHEPGRHGDQRNFHAHFLLTTRVVEPDGVLGAKTRQLDVSSAASVEVEKLRTAWESLANEALEEAGSSERVSRLSHARRGDGLLPQLTLGVAASAMERRGDMTELGRRNREIAAYNADFTAHQADEAGFRVAVTQVERRRRPEQNTGLASVSSRLQPTSPVHEGRRVSEHALSISRTTPSFSERRAGSERRMAAARASLGAVERRSALPSDAITRAAAELKIRDQEDPEALLARVHAAWASDGPIVLRRHYSVSPKPLTDIISLLSLAGLGVPEQQDGTQRIYPVPAQSLVTVLAGLRMDSQNELLTALREASRVSREEAARYANQQLLAARKALEEAVRETLRVGEHAVVVNFVVGRTGPCRDLVSELLQFIPAGVQKVAGDHIDQVTGTTRWTTALQPLVELVATAGPPQNAWFKQLARAAADSDNLLGQRSTAARQLAIKLLQGTAASRAPANGVPLAMRLRDVAITEPSLPGGSQPKPKTQNPPETTVVARELIPKSVEDIVENVGIMTRKRFADEGEIFTRWAASWSRAAIKKDSAERDARRMAWEKTVGPEKVAEAITMLREWAASSKSEFTTWALSVEAPSKSEIAKLILERREVSRRQKELRGQSR